MTNEEILDALARDYERIDPDSDLANCIRALVSQAYEEAAQAECRYCRYGLPAVAVTGSATDALVPLGETCYLHRADGAYLHGDMPCESQHIRALKDSLAPAGVTP